jgi:hypothetical protein
MKQIKTGQNTYLSRYTLIIRHIQHSLSCFLYNNMYHATHSIVKQLKNSRRGEGALQKDGGLPLIYIACTLAAQPARGFSL